MKVILSRKGFDSGYGGHPSVILPDGTMISFPIPCSEDEVCYRDVKTYDNKSMMDIMTKLNRNIKCGNKLLKPDSMCHLDPDLNYYAKERKEGWRGCFGQIGASQSVLNNNNIKEGDLFLFFGWFNDCEDYKFKKGDGKHTIFGYLQIDKIIDTTKDDIPEWLKEHPHAKNVRRIEDSLNRIYIAKEYCTFNPKLKGYGVFKYSEQLDLTKKGMNRTKWDLPDIFRNVSITYHNSNNWKENYFKSACRGQEFVIEESEDIEKWAIDLIEKHVVEMQFQ